LTATLAFPNFRNYLWAVLVGLGIAGLCLISPLLGFGAIVGVGFFILALTKPVFMCYVIIPAIILTVGMPRGKLIPLLLPNEAVLALSAALALVVVLVRRRESQPIPLKVIVALAILLIGSSFLPILTYLWRRYPLGVRDLFSLISPAKFILLFWVFTALPETEQDRRRLVQWLLLWGSVMSIVGLLQAGNLGFVTNLLKQWYPTDHTEQAANLGRVTSLLGAWNALGTFLMVNVLLAIALMAIKHRRLYQINMLIALGLGGACLLASGSFASAGGLVAGIVIAKFADRRGVRVLLYLLLGLFVAAVILSPILSTRLAYQFRNSNESGGVPETMSYRLEVWSKFYIPIISKNLLTGVEPTMVNVTWQWAESQYIYLLFRSGVISLLAHLAWVTILTSWLYQKIRSGGEFAKPLAVTLFALFIVLSVMGFTNEVFTLSGANEYLWIMLGLLVKS